MTSATSVPRESSHRDELLMKQSLLFSDTLKDLKGLRKQLYSAAEYFELTYNKAEQKEIVEDTVKDYAIKALVNTVDHIGSVAYKVSNFLDDKLGEISGFELRLSCMEQRLRTCQEFVNIGGLSQQSLVLEGNKHHKRYIFPVKQRLNAAAETKLEPYHTRICGRLDSHQFKNIGFQAIEAETPSESVKDEFYVLRSPQPLPRKSPKLFTSMSLNQRQDNRSTSPRRFPLLRSGSVMQRSTSPRRFPLLRSGSVMQRSTSPRRFPLLRSGSVMQRSPSLSHSNTKKRCPSEPRGTVSLSSPLAEKEKVKDMEQYSNKSKRLFKAMLSLRKSKKDVTVYKFLDEN